MGEGRLRIWRHVIDLARPWRELEAAITTLAEKIDTARSVSYFEGVGTNPLHGRRETR